MLIISGCNYAGELRPLLKQTGRWFGNHVGLLRVVEIGNSVVVLFSVF